jgi:hypothetical protein
VNELLQSDVVVFGIAMFGIAVSSVAILRDYLPREEPQLQVVPEPVALQSMHVHGDRAA